MNAFTGFACLWNFLDSNHCRIVGMDSLFDALK